MAAPLLETYRGDESREVAQDGCSTHRSRPLKRKVLISLALISVVSIAACVVTLGHASLFSTTLLSSADDDTSILLEVPGLGKLRGNVLGSGAHEFLNIPYALAPVGQRRFQPPLPNLSWPFELDATQLGPACMQSGANYTSEDCLQLSMWIPSDLASVRGMVPIFFWIHGGGLVAGSGTFYNGTSLSVQSGVAVVTCNYRLGFLGFYASEELARETLTLRGIRSTGGMNGALDTLEAMRWVRAHASSFGADSNKITVGGESGGSQLVCFHMHSRLTAELNIVSWDLQSGSCVGPWGPDAEADSLMNSRETIQAAGIQGLRELRALPASAYLNLTQNFSQQPHKVAGVDGWFLSALPIDLPFSFRGASEKVNVLLGGNHLDTTCVSAEPGSDMIGSDQLMRTLTSYFGPEDVAEILKMYAQLPYPSLPSVDRYRRLFWKISRDVGVMCPTLALASKLKEYDSNVYLYWLWFANNTATKHADELGFLFGFAADNPKWDTFTGSFDKSELFGSVDGNAGLSRKEIEEMTHYIQQKWGSFIHGREPWRGFEVAKQNHLNLTLNASEAFGYPESCKFWSEYIRRGPVQRSRYLKFGWLC